MSEETTDRPRWVKPVVLAVIIVVAVVVLFTWVFPWVESMQQDPTLGAATHLLRSPR
jgi:lipopolysaccharide export LptBFGC system permease protein LptF